VSEPCVDCGFRAELYDEADLLATLNLAEGFADHVLFGRTGDRPAFGSPASDMVEATHHVLHLLHEAGRAQHVSTAQSVGGVVQLNVSRGGVPKTAATSAELGWRGLLGDVQADRRSHGRPWQALSLWSADVIEDLQAQGHPIDFGSAGENVTVRGLDWATLTPGVRLGVGSALVQVSAYAIPCSKNAQWFTDGYFRRLAHDVSPGRSRLYASIVRPGDVTAGDAVVVEP
jgi:MOSC domain-containing protein YiiM